MTVTDSSALVSILLPNLNNRAFIEARLDSILQQSYPHWELIVADSYSEDGAWEILQAYGEKDERIKLAQIPREGVYPAINACIRRIQGEYVYIATSDDTMVPQALATMVAGLEAFPECDLCHTCLQVIDEQGRDCPGWWQQRSTAKFYGDWIDKAHIRPAPYDALLYCAVETVYHSLTQLLIRRSLFDKVGLFRSDWGPTGDFEWGMRAACAGSTLHLPETLATWRVHHQQVTTSDNHRSSQHRLKLLDMVSAALPTLAKFHPELWAKINRDKLEFIYRRQYLRLGLQERSPKLAKAKFLGQLLLEHPQFVAEFLYRRAFFPRNVEDDYRYIRDVIAQLDMPTPRPVNFSPATAVAQP